MGEDQKDVQQVKAELDPNKRTILLYSPDLNFCFSLSLLFQDRFNVITTTNLATLDQFTGSSAPDLVLLDAAPSEKLLERLEAIRRETGGVPVILLYVFSTRDAEFDREIRQRVDSVFYKPFEIGDISRRITDLLQG